MGLRDTFQNLATTVVAAFGDVAESGTYLAFSSTAYNASTGATTTVFSSVEAVSVILTDFSVRDVDGDVVRATDKKALIAAQALPGASPGPKDRIILSGVTWNVRKASLDPAGALHVLQIRRP